MLKIIISLVLSLALSGCATQLQRVDNWFKTYAPLVGENLILIGDIAVRAECSTTSQLVGGLAISVLKIVAKSYDEADYAAAALEANAAVAAQLCPAVAAIRASVGKVPAGIPSQVINIAPPPIVK